MNRLTIDLEALRHNIYTIDGWVTDHQASWTLVTKALCGHRETLSALKAMGVRSMADSRLANLGEVAALDGDIETWYLRLPHLPQIDNIVALSDVSLNSETGVILALNEAARRQDRIHRIIVMIELGDLREGVLPSGLIDFYEKVFDLSHVQVQGIGSNLGCLSGMVPSIDQFSQLALYRELLELKFKRPLPMISAGTSAVLPLLRDGKVPRSINHFRVGESVFLGTDLVGGGTLQGLRDDAMTLEVEVVEIKEKSLIPLGETADMAPFEDLDSGEHEPGQRGYRAVVTVGQLDTDIRGLTPLDPRYRIVGASSDLSVVNVADNPAGLRVGDTIKFRPAYGALVRLMLGKYIDKTITPELERFARILERSPGDLDLPPVLDALEDGAADPGD
ncbi:MAG: alanine racemase [Candidatus Krumholzibacteriia bacterium]